MMKKTISVLLTIVIAFGTCLVALPTVNATTQRSANTWPGQPMEILDAANNIYCFDISTEYNYFIFSDGNYHNGENNGVAWQTEDIHFTGGNQLYTPNLNDTSYVNGATICRVGVSKYNQDSASRTVYFIAPTTWETPSCYCWNNGESDASESSAYKVGDIIQFGSYRQSAIKNDNNETTGFNVEPIEWRILKIEDGKALLLSNEIIDNKQYNSTSATVNGYYGNNYAHSDIRDWLINDFYNCAFSNSEKECLVATTLDNSACSTNVNASGSYTKYSSEPTTDKVFLLSKDEANLYASEYFGTTATDYAYSNGYELRAGAGSTMGAHWLLRTAGNNTFQIYYLHMRWGNYVTYFNWDDDAIQMEWGVRPAICLDLENFYYSNDYDPTGQIEFYSTSTVDNLKIGSEFYLDVGYYVNGTLQNDVESYILTASKDNVIITKTTNDNGGCRYLVQTVGLGSTTITATHPTTNKTSSFTLNVTANNNVYTFDNIPKIAYEAGKETNIYNYSGLVVDSFKSEYINGEYLVTMNVYNSKNLYAAVTSYSSDGTIRDYCIIDKFEGNPTSFVNNLEAVYTSSGDLYYLIKNKYYYSGKSMTKETPVTINVPVGGHIEISNNVSTSEIAMLANVVGLTVDIVSVSKDFLDILPSSTAGDLNGIKLSVIKKVTEKFCKEKVLIDSFKKAAQETVMSGNWNKNKTDSFLEALNDKFQRFVNEDLIKAIEDSIFSVAGVSGTAESIILDILPTGPIINALYAGNSALNYMEFNDQFTRSRSFPTGVSIYAPQTGTEQISNGIKVQMNGNKNTVIHAYKVVKSTPFFDKQEVKEYTYDIAMYKDGNETQPSSPVTVSIPMPSDFTRFEQVKVFHVKEDGSLTDMNAQVVAGNLVFTTNHFSEYTVIELPLEASQLNIAGATLTLYDDISVNYMVSKDLFEGSAYANPYMVFEFNGHKTTVHDYTVNGDYYSFSFDNVAPDKMNDTIKSTLYAYVGDTLISTDTKEYSIAKYCYSMLESYCGDNYSELRTLLVDLLNYGADTQNYTGHNTENLVNADLTDAQKAWAGGAIETFTDVLNTKYATVDNPTVKWRGAELELNSAITMKFLIQIDNIDGLTVNISDDNNHNWTVKSSDFKKYTDGYYYVYFNGLDASQMSDNIYLTVYNGDTIVSNTVRYSIESYASAMKDSTNDKLSTLVHSMMKYGNSAKQYKNKGVN